MIEHRTLARARVGTLHLQGLMRPGARYTLGVWARDAGAVAVDQHHFFWTDDVETYPSAGDARFTLPHNGRISTLYCGYGYRSCRTARQP